MNGHPVFKHATVEEISGTDNPWVYLYYWLPFKKWRIGQNYLEPGAWVATLYEYILGTFFLVNAEFVVFTKTK